MNFDLTALFQNILIPPPFQTIYYPHLCCNFILHVGLKTVHDMRHKNLSTNLQQQGSLSACCAMNDCFRI